MDADKNGVLLAASVGYAPTGLSAFLERLAQRDKALKDRSGLFASHPETQARLDAMSKLLAARKLTAGATVAPRFHAAIAYKPVPVDQLATAPASGAAPTKTEAKPSSRFGLAGLNPLGHEKSRDASISSAGSRGVNPDRDAKGGPNPAPVPVTLTAAEIAAFRQGIA